MTPSPARPDPLTTAADPAPLAAWFAKVRATSLARVATLSAEDCQVQSMPDASPAKWHLAHTTWFFETFVLEPKEPGFRPHEAAYRSLFNSYYQGVGDAWPRARRGLVTRPSLDEVRQYRAAVDARVLRLLEARQDDAALQAIVRLGLHHEQQHQELLLTDLKHLLSGNPLHPPYAPQPPRQPAPPEPLRWIERPGGLVEVGHDPALDGDFHFDNEGPRHTVYLAPHALAHRPVSQAEYLAFIDAGGYRDPRWWLSTGWDWVCQGRREAPLYWAREDGRWWCHSLHGRIEPDPASPVCHLSYFEADAYARWAGARLPTEAEWEAAARTLGPGALSTAHLANRGIFHPQAAQPGSTGALVQMFGDVWEWTQSSYAPYPGYRTPEGAIGEYNGKFMCNQYVLRGGSCATPRGHLRASYRNFFPPEAQWQFSGLRLAR